MPRPAPVTMTTRPSSSTAIRLTRSADSGPSGFRAPLGGLHPAGKGAVIAEELRSPLLDEGAGVVVIGMEPRRL